MLQIGRQSDGGLLRGCGDVRDLVAERHGRADRAGVILAEDDLDDAAEFVRFLRSRKKHLGELLERVAPETMQVFALGPDNAAALLLSIGDSRGLLISEAAFARLCGVAPIPAEDPLRTGPEGALESLFSSSMVR
ncbi:hypothetical protein [Nocardia pneumoniae]|uniref:hypothetical protein n=1 Tax=Nocardia pneumoniae TaxID=228601 RepID=UPI0012F648FA|nr:hypothetical protein [Nocardia pneumoniae]